MTTPVLPCPECRMRECGGTARIGNRRNSCGTCNNFASTVFRITSRRLRDVHLDEYASLRMQVEYELYPQVMSTFNATHPRAAR